MVNNMIANFNRVVNNYNCMCIVLPVYECNKRQSDGTLHWDYL